MTSTPPPPYPRVPHLVAGRGTADDRVLSAADAAALLAGEVVVEEKLDGANVMVWTDGDVVTCSLRSGPDGADRAGQLGPLKAWVAERAHELAPLLSGGRVLYGEWLLLVHSVGYDRLPSYLLVLDVLDADGRFLTVDARNALTAEHGLVVPPEVGRGVFGTVGEVEARLGPSAFGDVPAEGVVVRSTGRERRVGKLLRPGFRRLEDAEWAGGRPRNGLVGEEAAWR